VAEPFDPARYVPVAAAAVGLPLAPGELDEVVAAFAVLALVARPVMAFALPEELIAAAVFAPDDVSA
jgi:hypothetical protein